MDLSKLSFAKGKINFLFADSKVNRMASKQIK